MNFGLRRVVISVRIASTGLERLIHFVVCLLSPNLKRDLRDLIQWVVGRIEARASRKGSKVAFGKVLWYASELFMSLFVRVERLMNYWQARDGNDEFLGYRNWNAEAWVGKVGFEESLLILMDARFDLSMVGHLQGGSLYLR
jgi:hypothetical protein